MTSFSIVAGLTACGLTLLTTWLRERYRHGRVLKVSRELPAGSVYIDDCTGVRIQVGPVEPVGSIEPPDGSADPVDDGSL
ncbi:hypothetical protein [Streptomyces sp. KR55]|uniref:hypothetical protein n=1 Tax=Streptomyces sp. KR55 TaxID=3457425 RepID=UPI003FD6855E